MTGSATTCRSLSARAIQCCASAVRCPTALIPVPTTISVAKSGLGTVDECGLGRIDERGLRRVDRRACIIAAQQLTQLERVARGERGDQRLVHTAATCEPG